MLSAKLLGGCAVVHVDQVIVGHIIAAVVPGDSVLGTGPDDAAEEGTVRTVAHPHV